MNYLLWLNIIKHETYMEIICELSDFKMIKKISFPSYHLIDTDIQDIDNSLLYNINHYLSVNDNLYLVVDGDNQKYINTYLPLLSQRIDKTVINKTMFQLIFNNIIHL